MYQFIINAPKSGKIRRPLTDPYNLRDSVFRLLCLQTFEMRTKLGDPKTMPADNTPSGVSINQGATRLSIKITDIEHGIARIEKCAFVLRQNSIRPRRDEDPAIIGVNGHGVSRHLACLAVIGWDSIST